MQYEAVIGLEVHVQLQTESKLFGSAGTSFGANANTNIDTVSLGLPGSLPVLNDRVVNLAIMLGLATNSEINHTNRFARKHYFYPDLPKGYQISQFEEPICERGSLEITVADHKRSIGIKRIHIEEDAGKTIHQPEQRCSLIDLNRAGVPLVEIVSEPELRSAAEAAAYLKKIRQLVRWLGISDGNMEEGSLRCDANVSLRPVGALTFGTRTEIKNINSFKFVEKAIEYEIARQMKVLKNDQDVIQQTLLYDSVNDVTRPMRGKEEALDYRYFPDPDLPPVVVEDSWIESVRQLMPELPDQVTAKLVEQFGLSLEDSQLLTTEREQYEYFEKVQSACRNPKAALAWITSELFGKLNRLGLNFADNRISADNLGRLIKLIDNDVISGKTAKVIFEELWETDQTPEQIVADKGLQQVTDTNTIREWVDFVLKANPKQLEQYQAGNSKLFSFFVGQVMKLAKGNASPTLVNEILEEKIKLNE